MIILLVIGIFLVSLIFGLPVAFGLMAAASIGVIILDLPLVALPSKMFTGISYPLLAIPFFVFAGNIMTTSGMAKRLIDLSDAIVGFVRSSLAQINILTSVFFAGVSGNAISDVSSVGSILIPAMKEQNYTPEEAAVITGTSSQIGPIIPPSVFMIIYGALTDTSIIGMFLAGILPGLALGLGFMIVTHWLSLRRPNSMGNRATASEPYSLGRIVKALKENALVIPLPILIVGGIYSGVFTVTEAGVSVLAYSLVVSLFIYRTVTVKDLFGIMLDSAMTAAVVGAIIVAATLFSYLLSIQHFASWYMEVSAPLHDSPVLYTLSIFVMFFVLGCFVPTTAVLIVFAPFMPLIGTHTGLHPFHLGLVVILTLGIGGVTPPYGTILFMVADMAKTTVVRMMPTLVPYILAMVAVVLLTIFAPFMTLWIPQMTGTL